MIKSVCIIIFILIASFLSSCSLLRHKDKGKDLLSERDRYEFNYSFMEAEKQKMLGNFEDANFLYEKCKKLDPSSAATLYELSTLLIQKEDYKSAIENAKQAVKLNPNNNWYKAMLAVLYKQTNDANAAISVYKDLLKSNPDRVDFLYELANLYNYIKKYDDALKAYESIEANYGINETVTLEKERIYLVKGNKEKAYDEIRKLINSNPTEVRYHGILAESYVSEGDFEKAREIYDQMLTIDPNNGLVHLSLSDFYRLAKEYDKSFNELKIAFASTDVEIDVKIKMLITFLNFSNESVELKEQSYELLKILLTTYPEDTKVHTLYADFLMKDKKIEAAREQLRIVAKNEKSKYLIWEQLLLIEGTLADYNSMYIESSEALEYFPNQPVLNYFQGLSAYQLKKYDVAEKTLKSGVEIVVDNPTLKADMYSILADTYNKLGKMKESDNAMEQVLKIDKSNKIILNNYSYYLSQRGDSLDKAERMSLICVELDPNNATYLDTYAWVLYKQNKFEKALEAIEKAYKNGGSDDAVVVEHYGDIVFKLGKTDRANELWNEAEKLGKGSEFLNKKIIQKTLVE
jgi:pentatricopeptide repeat protein